MVKWYESNIVWISFIVGLMLPLIVFSVVGFNSFLNLTWILLTFGIGLVLGLLFMFAGFLITKKKYILASLTYIGVPLVLVGILFYIVRGIALGIS